MLNRKISYISLAISLVLTSQSFAANYELPKVTVTANQENGGGVEGYRAFSSRSSTRTQTLLIDTPQTISTVTQQQILDQNITNMTEAARYVPGVNVQQGEANRDQLTIRGNNTTADFFIDGARDDLEFYRDFYNVERVEFLKGPNALAFGRGGSGGAINRVLKTADDKTRRQLILTGGSFENKRLQADIGGKVNDKVALRFNSMYENTNTFRENGDMERSGFNPTLTFKISDETKLEAGYEHFRDIRFNDRGLPSQNGRVVNLNERSFVGNPDGNKSESRSDGVYAILNHDFDADNKIRFLTRFNNQYKFYENIYANSPVDNVGNFNLAAYNNLIKRDSFINQLDFTTKFQTFGIKHNALIGGEITSQENRNSRPTGFFNNNSTSQTISIFNPIDRTPVTYRYSGSDNDSTTKINVAALYLQDQIELNKNWQIVAGLRYDNFEIEANNHRTQVNFKRSDNLVSPRAGVIFKPQENISLYTSYSTTYLPASGDQFAALTLATSLLKPEKMENYEIGSKWEVSEKLDLAASFYILDRQNTRANDPNNAGFFIPTGSSRTRGVELSANGKITDKWQTILSYAMQDAEITSTTATAQKGRTMGLVPRHTAAWWNKYDFSKQFGAALGAIYQSSQFASVDNSVKLKAFNRFDGAAFYKINNQYRLQLNVENLFDKRYEATAHNNHNIQPGSTRAFKVSLIADF
jgi:catecholate siderophore receptor